MPGGGAWLTGSGTLFSAVSSKSTFWFPNGFQVVLALAPHLSLICVPLALCYFSLFVMRGAAVDPLRWPRVAGPLVTRAEGLGTPLCCVRHAFIRAASFFFSFYGLRDSPHHFIWQPILWCCFVAVLMWILFSILFSKTVWPLGPPLPPFFFPLFSFGPLSIFVADSLTPD